MTTEERLDQIDDNMKKLLVSTTQLHERVKNLNDKLLPLKEDILNQCKNDIMAWGWKSVTAILTAMISGIAGLVISILDRFG